MPSKDRMWEWLPHQETSLGPDRPRNRSSLADQDSQTKQPDIYENIVIGNFLFGLGAAMGWRHRNQPAPPTSVSLLQQTPLDERLGDVLVENARLIRLIEFKRTTNRRALKKETEKRDRLAKALESGNLQPISRRLHWFVGSDFSHHPERYHILP